MGIWWASRVVVVCPESYQEGRMRTKCSRPLPATTERLERKKKEKIVDREQIIVQDGMAMNKYMLTARGVCPGQGVQRIPDRP